MKRLFNHSIRQQWTPFMRSMAVLLALNLALLPLLSTANTTIALFEERGNEVPPVLEEEILKQHHRICYRPKISKATTGYMSRNRKHDFSDAQRAEIFRRDRASCVYSGRRLWVLDVGADWRFPVEWADHVTAVANGGTAQVEYGVCAHWRSNLRIGASEHKPHFLFSNGEPTAHYFALAEQMRQKMGDAAYLGRMEKLDDSDWYFNRSLLNLLMGTAYLHEYIGKRNATTITMQRLSYVF